MEWRALGKSACTCCECRAFSAMFNILRKKCKYRGRLCWPPVISPHNEAKIYPRQLKFINKHTAQQTVSIQTKHRLTCGSVVVF